jgi:hypothetical protein
VVGDSLSAKRKILAKVGKWDGFAENLKNKYLN